jgi:hypothetical protein
MEEQGETVLLSQVWLCVFVIQHSRGLEGGSEHTGLSKPPGARSPGPTARRGAAGARGCEPRGATGSPARTRAGLPQVGSARPRESG